MTREHHCSNGRAHEPHFWSSVPFESEFRDIGYQCDGTPRETR